MVEVDRGWDQQNLECRIYGALKNRFPRFLVIIDTDLKLSYVSAGSLGLIGFTPEEMLGITVDQMLHPEDLETVIPMAVRMIDTGADSIHNPSAAAAVEIPIRVTRKGGGWAPMSLVGRVFDEEGRILCLLRPSAERHALDAVLYKLSSGEGLSSLLGSVLDLVLSQFGVAGAWVVTEPEGVVSAKGVPEPPAVESRSLVDGLGAEHRVVATATGEEYWVTPIIGGVSKAIYGALVISAAREGGPSPYDVHVLQRTANLASLAFGRAKFDEVLESAANTDHLTGALNRRAVERQISTLAKDGDSFPSGVLFADLNDFKVINDKWGHGMGDKVLKIVASRIASIVRPEDAFGRLGGDEFVVVCRSLSRAAVCQIRDRIDAAVSQPIRIGDTLIPLSASIGVAMAHSRDEMVDVLHRSDADMYSRKADRGGGPLDENL